MFTVTTPPPGREPKLPPAAPGGVGLIETTSMAESCAARLAAAVTTNTSASRRIALLSTSPADSTGTLPAEQLLVLLLLQLVDDLDVVVGDLLNLLEALPLVVLGNL